MSKKIELQKVRAFFKRTVSKIKKKDVIVTLSILAIGGAVYVNYLLFSDPVDAIGYGENNMAETYGTESIGTGTDTDVSSSKDSYFSTTVLSRQKARDEALEVLQTVVESADAMQETNAQAFADISQIEREAHIETLVEAKGFEDCVAVVNGGTVNIVVKTNGLLANDIAKINEIVYEQAGILPVNVKIVERTN